ncbi:protein RRP5 homolog isoform X1 [Amphibalanus amphitrite]|uniref:protein RRP5 homolog isoform X1 n=2 Tax=Amphibalanus amphitrite TaxID=1232801 RepID=UPI001C909959|nr:protein RRP5 homolog isoform X1 [Amphibalanus amphitrite]
MYRVMKPRGVTGCYFCVFLFFRRTIMSEQYFPRGGKIKRKATDAEDKQDEEKLFDDQPKKKAKKQKVKQKKLKGEAKKTNGTAEDDFTHVEPLKQDDLEAQMVLLGRVKQVEEFHLLVSLPCHLVGSVPITNISSTYSRLVGSQQDGESAPALSDLFTTGQYVSCMVTKVDQSGHKVRNTLSVRPEDVNSSLPASALGPGLMLQCSVKSEEDNVFDIDCGIAGTRAVLPKSALGTDPPALVAGQVLWCLVDSVRAGDGLHTLTLSADPARLNGAEPSAECGLTRQTLLPGMRLPITVAKVLPGGLQVRLPFGVTGLIYKTQLDEPADCPDDYNPGAAAHARILYTLPVLRRVYLSLRPAVCRLPATEPDTDLLTESAGERLSAQVLDSDQHGVRMVLGDGDEGGAVAYAPVWHARRVGAGRWQRGEKASCTLLAYDAMDEVYIASMKGGKDAPKQAPSLEVGAKVTCRVKELLDQGCKVELDGGVFGFIPNHHLTNVPVKNLQTMFPVGKKLKCKVIHSDPERRRLVLTHNARLVNTGIGLAADSDQLKRGSTHHWIVTKVLERGLIMTGYSDLSGFVPAAFAGSALDDFFPGQIVQCSVHKVRQPSADGGGDRRVTLCPVREAGQQPWCGRVCTARVTGRAADRLLVITEDGQRAELPAGHLTDVPEHAAAQLARYKTGDEIEVVGLVAVGKKLVVSAKPLFLEYVKNKRYPSSAEEVVAGVRVPGSVIHSDERGVVVAFPSPYPAGTYRLRLQALCDGWQPDMSSLTGLEHRTIMLEVMPAPADSESTFVRLSGRINYREEQGGSVYLRRCLRELSELVPPSPAAGDAVTGQVMTCDPAGVTVRLPDGRVGALPGGEARAVGDTVSATVLQVTPAGHLSLAAGERILPAAVQSGVTVGHRYTARVLAAPAAGYLLTALLQPPAPPRLVQLPARLGLNDLTVGPARPQPGDTLNVLVKSCEDGVIVGIDCDRRNFRDSDGKTTKDRPRDKNWQKRNRSGPGARPSPRRPQSATAISYSRFSLQDDS